MIDKYFPLYLLVFFGAFLLTVAIERVAIPKLKLHARQPIYTDGPAWHIKKSGTPTMGGLAFLCSISLSLILSALFLYFQGMAEESLALIISALYAIGNSLVGIIDDLKKLKNKQNGGLTPKQKLLLQFFFAVCFLAFRSQLMSDSTVIYFSSGKVDLGILYYPISLLALLGTVNCANLTDGVDGLASSVAFSIGISLFYISAALFHDVAIIAAAIIGATVGFLIFNINPAKIFMGDTGSLFLGALIVSTTFSLGNPLLIILIGGVYVIEGFSVIMQVVYYKLTKKRLFKMAPLHHHLERCGISENKICIISIIVTLILSSFAFVVFLP